MALFRMIQMKSLLIAAVLVMAASSFAFSMTYSLDRTYLLWSKLHGEIYLVARVEINKRWASYPFGRNISWCIPLNR